MPERGQLFLIVTITLSGKIWPPDQPSEVVVRGRRYEAEGGTTARKRHHFIKIKTFDLGLYVPFFPDVNQHELFKMTCSQERLDLRHLKLFVSLCPKRVRVEQMGKEGFPFPPPPHRLAVFIGSQHLLCSFSHASVSRCES